MKKADPAIVTINWLEQQLGSLQRNFENYDDLQTQFEEGNPREADHRTEFDANYSAALAEAREMSFKIKDLFTAKVIYSHFILS